MREHLLPRPAAPAMAGPAWRRLIGVVTTLSCLLSPTLILARDATVNAILPPDSTGAWRVRAPDPTPETLRLLQVLSGNDAIITDRRTRVSLDFDGAAVLIGRKAAVKVSLVAPDRTWLELIEGSLRALIAPGDSQPQILRIESEGYVLNARDGDFAVAQKPGAGLEVVAFEGAVQVTGPGLDFQLQSGQLFEGPGGGGAGTTRILSPEEMRARSDASRSSVEERMNVLPPPPPPPAPGTLLPLPGSPGPDLEQGAGSLPPLVGPQRGPLQLIFEP